MDRMVAGLRVLLIVVLLASAGYFFALSLHWPLMADSPIMHYVVFLMHHGLEPYRSITDNNMPGSYLTEIGAMSLFGTGDLGWRLYDFFLLIAMTLAMMAIARRQDWLAGLYGGGIFLLLHGSEGPSYAVEREQVITAFLMVGYLLLFEAVRRQKPLLLLPFGFVAGMACSIKPTFSPFVLALLLFALLVLARRRIAVLRYALWGISGLALALLLNIAFLLKHHALQDFWFVTRNITPAYVSLAHPGLHTMLAGLIPRTLLILLLGGIVAAAINRGWNWERWALLLGVVFGMASYFLQQKGFNHHRYTYEAILLFLIGLEFLRILRHPGWPRLLGAAGILATVFIVVPHYVEKMRQLPAGSVLTTALEQDLTRLGGDKLQGQVQCFDQRGGRQRGTRPRGSPYPPAHSMRPGCLAPTKNHAASSPVPASVDRRTHQ